MPAYVYLIEEVPFEAGKSGPWTKIGYSKNPPEWRMEANLTRGNPRNIRVAEAFEYESEQAARSAEREAHEHFKNYHHQKEWFNLSASEITTWFVKGGAKKREEENT